MYQSILPGRPWLDNNGKRIEAHGGSVFYENGTYYFYGENKEFTDGRTDIIHWGVKCYSSTDLYNWKDEGVIIQPDLENESSTLHPSARAERPHIIYNRKTGKYVCWIKVICSDRTQRSTILQADRLLGPYELVKERYLPLGMSAGDFDLQVDERTGKAYYIFERVHTNLVVAELTEDYLDVSGVYSEHFFNGHPPFTREAPAHFIRGGKHYLITSGTTGYYPNPSEAAVADDWHGPYTILGNPHPKDQSETSYHSQISSVFKVQGTQDLFIACGDRWLPDRMCVPYEWYKDNFIHTYGPGRGGEDDSEDKIQRILRENGVQCPPKENTSISNYVWLPIRFEGDMPIIEWQEEWTIEDAQLNV